MNEEQRFRVGPPEHSCCHEAAVRDFAKQYPYDVMVFECTSEHDAEWLAEIMNGGNLPPSLLPLENR